MALGLKPRSSESNELKTETKHQYLKTGVSEITVEKDDFIVLIMTSWGKKGICERNDACHPTVPLVRLCHLHLDIIEGTNAHRQGKMAPVPRPWADDLTLSIPRLLGLLIIVNYR